MQNPYKVSNTKKPQIHRNYNSGYLQSCEYQFFSSKLYTLIKRYEENGIKGLETRPGQGRKPIMDCSDEEAVRKAIEEDRQSVSKAREAWQNATGKEASDITFKRFLETLVQDISV